MSGKTGPAVLVAALCLAALSAVGSDVPRSARMMRESGNQFLAAKKYADAVDSYFQALEICPDYPEAHYNLAIAFLKGSKEYRLAKHHFEKYLDLSPEAADREDVQALVVTLADRVPLLDPESRQVLRVVGGRLLVSGTEWVRAGEHLEVGETGKAPATRLMAQYVYPDCVLTERVWNDRSLDTLKPGLVASIPAP
jgi:tetratricopeptide (TPR) repeat protein